MEIVYVFERNVRCLNVSFQSNVIVCTKKGKHFACLFCVEIVGVEPMTYRLRTCRSTN